MKLFTEDEIKFIEENYPVRGSRWVADKLGKTNQQIISKVKKKRIKKIQGMRAAEVRTKWNMNAEDFILIKRPEEAYLLGMIWADGYIHIRKTGVAVLKLEILKSDMDKISHLFALSGKWTYLTRHRNGRQEQTSIECSNKKLVLFLQTLDYKSGRVNPEKAINHIPKEFLQYWLRGYFDGDGCAYYNKELCLKQLSISASYEYYWKPIEDMLNQYNIKHKTCQRIQGKNKHSVLKITGIYNIESFKKLVYSDRLDIGIQRKNDKIDEMIVSKKS